MYFLMTSEHHCFAKTTFRESIKKWFLLKPWNKTLPSLCFDFNGKYRFAIGGYYQSECEYFDGGIYKYIIRKYYYSTREPIQDKFGLLPNSGLMVTDSLTSKKMSKDEFLSFLKICRNIQKHQKEKLGNNKGTGVLKFDRSNIPLFVSHNSIEKVKLDSLLNSVFNEK